ncbi:PH-like domain-containing protein [Arthrobacter mobilis]|uniref:PH domain-containing protein n=1 Tax=Arthrobacter mobilis TaxID=2724944 RepID=A0A7X6HBJ4_9MICC|nr:hypothetical protein [Arthrobacter mobilis]NKX54058.1 hypothetical protein [Arthrobacter mobilis]
MDKIGPGLLTLALIVVLAGLMFAGWRSRLRRQQDVAVLPALPQELGQPLEAYEGQYVVTTTAGDWLDRIGVHGLGVRGKALLRIYPHGLLIDRTGAPDIYIPRRQLAGVRTESGMIGKFVEKDGLAVVSWQLGDRGVDTAFRTRNAADKGPLLARLTSLVPTASQDEE